MIKVAVPVYDPNEHATIIRVLLVPNGVSMALKPQDTVGGRQRVLQVFDANGTLVALFAEWKSATKEEDDQGANA